MKIEHCSSFELTRGTQFLALWVKSWFLSWESCHQVILFLMIPYHLCGPNDTIKNWLTKFCKIWWHFVCVDFSQACKTSVDSTIFGLDIKLLSNFVKPLSRPMIIFSCDQAALQMVFSVCLSVCPSVCPSHLFDYVPIIGSSWKFQELLPMTNVMSMQQVKVRGQRSRSQRSQPNLTVSGL